jgi:hypothetical protein
MAHHIFFYPVGNGDTSQIVLENGKRILFDFRHLKKAEDGEGPEIDLQARLREELDNEKRDSFDVVAFTHGDKDHIENSTEFFELLHAKKYQGTGRIKIDTLWVPAAMILETATNDQQSSEFVLWRQEARYRLKRGEGIRVFSKPEKLKDWLKENDLTLESRRHLITDAGETVPEFSVDEDGVEFFCHSPFIKHADEREDLRNEAALIFNVRFSRGSRAYDYLAVGDSKWDILEDIVRTTNRHGNSDRLAWDLFNIPHHCSYLALSDEKGETETTPKPLVKELLEHGKEGAFMVSSSEPIRDTAEGRNQSQPPHIQAKKCYQRHLREVGGARLFVTMEEPNTTRPKPLDFRIDDKGITFLSAAVAPAIAITSTPTRRAG